MKILSIAPLLLFFALASAAETIDINSAPAEDLVKIVHIGEARAKELISLRPFSSIDELSRINGIGPARVKDIKNQGLAWVPPAKVEPEKGLAAAAAAAAPGKPAQIFQEKTKAGGQIIIIAMITAVFSGAIVIIMKTKLN